MNRLYDKIYEAIDNGIQKALIITDNQSLDTSVRFHNKEISTELIPYEYRTVNMGNAGIWCEYNLGAYPGLKPKDWYGNYYAWGETETKNEYSWEIYMQTNDTITKYNKKDTLQCLEPIDDVVILTLCNKFRMPTKDDYEILIKNTINEWVENYKGIKGLNGRLFTAENGNTLFFPAAGYYIRSKHYDEGKNGSVWTASFDPGSAFELNFNSDVVRVGMYYRYMGSTVRGVLKPSSN